MEMVIHAYQPIHFGDIPTHVAFLLPRLPHENEHRVDNVHQEKYSTYDLLLFLKNVVYAMLSLLTRLFSYHFMLDIVLLYW
jgi:hypothetical protein